MPQNTYTLKSPTTGKEYQVDWTKDTDPTEDDFKRIITHLSTLDKPEPKVALKGITPVEKPDFGGAISESGEPVIEGGKSHGWLADTVWNAGKKVKELGKGIYESIPAVQDANYLRDNPIDFAALDKEMAETRRRKAAGEDTTLKFNPQGLENNPIVQEFSQHPLKSAGGMVLRTVDPMGLAEGEYDIAKSSIQSFAKGDIGGGTVEGGLALLPFLGLRKPKVKIAPAIEHPPPITNPARLLEAPKRTQFGDIAATQHELPIDMPEQPRPNIPAPEKPGVPLDSGSIAEQRTRAHAGIEAEAQRKILDLKLKQSEAVRMGDHTTATTLEDAILKEKIAASEAKSQWEPNLPPKFEELSGTQPGLFGNVEEFGGGTPRPTPFEPPQPNPLRFSMRSVIEGNNPPLTNPRAGRFIADESGNVLPPDRGFPPTLNSEPLNREVPPLPVPDKKGNYTPRTATGRFVGPNDVAANLQSFENYPVGKYPIGDTVVLGGHDVPTENIRPFAEERNILLEREPIPEFKPLERTSESLLDKLERQPPSAARDNAIARLKERTATEAAAKVAEEKAAQSEQAKILANVSPVERVRISDRYPHLPQDEAIIRGMTDIEKARILDRADKRANTELRNSIALAKKAARTSKGSRVIENSMESRIAAAEAADTSRASAKVPPKSEDGVNIGAFNLQDFYERLVKSDKGKKLAEELKTSPFHLVDEDGVPLKGFPTRSEAEAKAALFNKVKKADIFSVEANKSVIPKRTPKVEAPKEAPKVEEPPVKGTRERTIPAPISPEYKNTPYGKFMERLRENTTSEAARKFDLREWHSSQAEKMREVDSTGEKGIIQRAAAMEGGPRDIVFPPLKLKQDVLDQLINAATEANKGDIFKQQRAGQAIRKMNRGEYIAPAERKLISNAFPEQYRTEIQNLYSNIPYDELVKIMGHTNGTAAAFLEGLRKWTLGSSKTLKAAFDASFVGVQARGAMFTKGYRKAFAPAWEALKSDAGFKKNLNRIMDSPWYDVLTEDMGIHIADLEKKKGDLYLSSNSTLDKLPPLRAGHRAATTFLNEIRYQNGVTQAKLATRRGIANDSVAMKALGKAINESTGYGTLSEKYHIPQAERFLSNAIWSPRLTASRLNYLQLLNPKAYVGPRRFGQMQRLQSAATVAASSLAAMALLEQAGMKAHWNPFDPAFGKVEKDGEFVDTTGGFGSLAALVTRSFQAVTGGELRDRKGNVIKGGFLPNATELASAYGENKLNPNASLALKLARQKNPYTDKPYNIPAEAVDLSIPLFAESMYEIAKGILDKDDNLLSIVKALPAFGGVNMYDVNSRNNSLATDIVGLAGYDTPKKRTLGQEIVRPFKKEIRDFSRY